MEILEEIWAGLPEFPNYEISNFGRIYNERLGCMMSPSLSNYDRLKITLVSDWDGRRHTRSVALLVADRFVGRPNVNCDHVIVLNDDPLNVAAYNLAWRPRSFAMLYARQMRTNQPHHFKNLPVCDVTTGMVYASIIEAGIAVGLLFKDIWRSSYSGDKIYPYGSVFEIVTQSMVTPGIQGLR